MKNSLVGLALVCLVIVVVVGCIQPTPTAGPASGGTPASGPPLVTQAPATRGAPTPAAVAPKAVTPAPARAAPDAAAKSATPYYQGKTIELVAPTAAGGGSDTVSRIWATFLSRHIPGNPKFIVRNKPGGAGMIGTNVFYERAKPDGMELLHVSSSPFSLQLRGSELIKFNLTDLRFVGHVARSESVLMVRQGLKKNLTDPRSRTLVVAVKEGEETWNGMLVWGKEFLGWNVRWLQGFNNAAEMELAVRRGEADIFATANAYIIRRAVADGVVEPLVTTGSFKDGKFLRRPDFPDVATFDEILGGKRPAGLPWQAFIAWVGPSQIDKALAAPRATPDNVMAILRDAFGRMAKDPEFDAMIRKLVSEEYEVGVGPETESLAREVLKAPPEAISYSRDLQIKFGLVAK